MFPHRWWGGLIQNGVVWRGVVQDVCGKKGEKESNEHYGVDASRE